MIVITDSNIIISALIRPKGAIAQIFKSDSQIQFFAPSFLLYEVKEHFDLIQANTTLTPKELKAEFKHLKSRIQVIDLETIPKTYIKKAYEIVKDIDEDDTFFVALNRYKKYKIWTTDKVLRDGLNAKGYNICITTAELRKHLYKK